MPRGNELMYKTVEELEVKVEEYFKSAEVDGAWYVDGEELVYAPTMSGLALYLGMDRKSLLNYSKRDDYFPTIKKAKARVEQHLERKLYGNNVTGLIFNLKNNFGWKDKQEEDQSDNKAVRIEFIDAKRPDTTD